MKACGCVAKRPACKTCFFSDACAGQSPPNCCVLMTCGRSSWLSPMGTLNESTSEEVPFTYDTCPSSWVRVRARARARVMVRVRVRAWVRARVRARVRVRVRGRVRVRPARAVGPRRVAARTAWCSSPG